MSTSGWRALFYHGQMLGRGGSDGAGGFGRWRLSLAGADTMTVRVDGSALVGIPVAMER